MRKKAPRDAKSQLFAISKECSYLVSSFISSNYVVGSLHFVFEVNASLTVGHSHVNCCETRRRTRFSPPVRKEIR